MKLILCFQIKRICLWTNYSEYLVEFLSRRRENEKFIYLVACAHPFIIEKIIQKEEDRHLFNKYIDKIIKSHYVAEGLIRNQNLKFVIGHITMSGVGGYNLMELCSQIKQKMEEFGN